MLRFTDPTTSPPGNAYRYVQPETKVEMTALNLRTLGQYVKFHRIGNDLPIGVNFDREVEDGACRAVLQQYPDYTGCQEDNGTQIKQGWSLNDVISWASTMADWAKKGFKFVSQEQANDRAEICSRCPKNIDIAGCWGCGGVGDLIGKARGSRSTRYDEQLRVCGACGCVLKLMCHLPMESLDKTHSDDLPYDVNCWIPKEKAGLRK